MPTRKVTPIIKWFFIYKNNVLEADSFEHLSDNHVRFTLIDKTSVLLGPSLDKSDQHDVRVEGWSSRDLMWEDRQYGHWKRVFIETYDKLKVQNYGITYTNEHGKMHIVECSYENSKSLTKYDNEWNDNKEWKHKYTAIIELPVHFNPSLQEPLQTYLNSNDLWDFYFKGENNKNNYYLDDDVVSPLDIENPVIKDAANYVSVDEEFEPDLECDY